jgi:hypothetical protein
MRAHCKHIDRLWGRAQSVLSILFTIFSALNCEKPNTEDTKNHREPQRNSPFSFRDVLTFFPTRPQCSLWPFSVSSVLNSDKCGETVRAPQTCRRPLAWCVWIPEGMLVTISMACAVFVPPARPDQIQARGCALSKTSISWRIVACVYRCVVDSEECPSNS